MNENLLGALKEIKLKLDNHLTWALFGGVACAIHQGNFYRTNSDIDIIVEDNESALKNIFSDLQQKNRQGRRRYNAIFNSIKIEFLVMEGPNKIILADGSYQFKKVEQLNFFELLLPVVDLHSLLLAKQRHQKITRKDLLSNIQLDINKLEHVLLYRLVRDFSHLPKEIIDNWLLPLARTFGWPPTARSNWQPRLRFEQPQFFDQAIWHQKVIDMARISYANMQIDAFENLVRGYTRGEQNEFTEKLGRDGQIRFNRALKFISEHGIFPKTPILLKNLRGQYEVLDGNHRLSAYYFAQKQFEAFQAWSDPEKKRYLDIINIPNLAQPISEQTIWVCEPDWSKSTNPFAY